MSTSHAPHDPNERTQSMHRIVLMRFQQGLTPDDEKAIQVMIEEVRKEVFGVRDALFGPNTKVDADFSHGLHLTFASLEAHEAYLPHPLHVRLGQFLRDRGLEFQLMLLADPT